MGNSIKVIKDPSQRNAYIAQLLSHDNLPEVAEDANAAYCPVSLTSAPANIKAMLAERQRLLLEEVLAPAGIAGYDPATAPLSPDLNLTAQPAEVYLTDSLKIVSSRFFVGHNLVASTGMGVEIEKAKQFNRMAVILTDRKVRVTRMQPDRIIYLHYDNFAQQLEEFRQVFELLKQYEPGMGLDGDVPCLLGFKDSGRTVVNLEKLVYEAFPELKYTYDGTLPIAELEVKNPEIFS